MGEGNPRIKVVRAHDISRKSYINIIFIFVFIFIQIAADAHDMLNFGPPCYLFVLLLMIRLLQFRVAPSSSMETSTLSHHVLPCLYLFGVAHRSYQCPMGLNSSSTLSSPLGCTGSVC